MNPPQLTEPYWINARPCCPDCRVELEPLRESSRRYACPNCQGCVKLPAGGVIWGDGFVVAMAAGTLAGLLVLFALVYLGSQ